MTPDLMHQFRLTGIRHRQFAITVTHGHCRQGYFFPPGTVAAASFAAPAVVITVLNFVLIVSHLSGINSNNITITDHTACIQIAGNVLDNVQADKVATCGFGIGNQPFHFQIHFLRDTAFQHTDIKAKGSGRVVCLPTIPFTLMR